MRINQNHTGYFKETMYRIENFVTCVKGEGILFCFQLIGSTGKLGDPLAGSIKIYFELHLKKSFKQFFGMLD